MSSSNITKPREKPKRTRGLRTTSRINLNLDFKLSPSIRVKGTGGVGLHSKYLKVTQNHLYTSS